MRRPYPAKRATQSPALNLSEWRGELAPGITRRNRCNGEGSVATIGPFELRVESHNDVSSSHPDLACVPAVFVPAHEPVAVCGFGDPDFTGQAALYTDFGIVPEEPRGPAAVGGYRGFHARVRGVVYVVLAGDPTRRRGLKTTLADDHLSARLFPVWYLRGGQE